jgi:metal-responsive CopG/Arc/MetJ family transcriptional regulator
VAKVMLSLPEDLLAEIDRMAEETGRTRSGLLQYIARLYLLAETGRTPPGEEPGVREALRRAREVGARVPAATGFDSTAEIRRARDER